MRLNKGLNFLLLVLVTTFMTSCGSKNSNGTSSLTGWKFNDFDGGAGSNYKGQPTPPGMVLVEGGTFTMGHVQDDVMFDWNTTPVKMQVRSFYMDEAEVTNREYRLFLQWMEQVYPPNNENYRNIYTSVLPDTLVWRNTLGDDELLTETYLRHPSYNEYPVVGVSWIQANEYCKWRTNMVNEKILMDKGVLNNLHQEDSLKVEGKNHFDTQVYLSDPTLLFDGDSTIYKKGLPDMRTKSKGKRGRSSRGSKVAGTSKRSSRGSKGAFSGRHVKVSDGILTQAFRLPTEVEWEFAAKALVENREYNTLKGRKKFSWNGKYTRSGNKRMKGDEMANFKIGKGNYSGLPGWSDDGADITIAVKSYQPNALGLYDMTGNVAEWVADVYRPIVDNDANDFNYYRGNSYTKKLIDENGKVVVVDQNSVQYDTLDNGTIRAKFAPGSLKFIPITKSDAFMRENYEKSYNVDSKDGDLASTKDFYKEADDEAEDYTKPRMYNAPKVPKEIGESGYRKQMYDTKQRTTLISDKTRVYKGGSWRDRAFWLDPAQRRYLPQYMATNYIGFRCATDRLGPMTNKKRAAYNH